MEPEAASPVATRISPSVTAMFAAVMAAVLAVLPFANAWKAEREQAATLRAELSERTRAAEQLRSGLLAAEGEESRFSSLYGQLGNLAVPPSNAQNDPVWWSFLPFLVFVIGVGIWVFVRWSRPLADVETAALAAGEVQVTGATPIRSLLRTVLAVRSRLEDEIERAEARWRAGVEAAIGKRSASDLAPEVDRAFQQLEAAYDHRQALIRDDLERIVDAHETAREFASSLKHRARLVEKRWIASSHAARKAEAGLVGVGPQLEARYALEHDRLRTFHEAVRTLESALARSHEKAEELAQQAYRATDAAARELGRQARISRGGHAKPMEVPPLDEWAADLDATARDLRSTLAYLKGPLSLEATEWTDLEQEALASMVGCARSAREALDALGPLVRAVGHWAEAHEEDLRQTWARLKRTSLLEGDVTHEADQGLSLEGILADLDSSAEAARTRLDAATSRVERLLQAARG